MKSPSLEAELGGLLAPMLVQMSERGRDSAGFAVYHEPACDGAVKLTLYHGDDGFDWPAFAARNADALGVAGAVAVRGSHAVIAVRGDGAEAARWLDANYPEIQVMSVGAAMEIYKETGAPADVVAKFELAGVKGSHGLGHTRMATESAVTTDGSHPFSTGRDLCLVHNGSLSNHNDLRRWLDHRGIRIRTRNDSEVAAGYFTQRMAEGASLHEALEAGLSDLDGFYTFAVGTADGFAVLRDPIACKPAVLAETEDWVAMGSEFRALAGLPGIDGATIWEPEPGVVYSWGRAAA